MSVDTPATEFDRRPQFDCGVCGGSTGDGGRFLAAYPSDPERPLSVAEADGLVPLCGCCAEEVAELTVAWTDLERPPVSSTDTIVEGYAAVADQCSFCEGAIEGAVLGVESWTSETAAPTQDWDDHDNYALCGDCLSIFEEFLRGVGPE